MVRTLVSIVFLALAALTSASSASCGHTCRFSFCPEVFRNTFTIGIPDQSFTTAICDRTGTLSIGVVGSTGEAYVSTESGPVLISQYNPFGLNQAFASSFFKSYTLTNFGSGKLSGVGHEVSQSNQADFLNYKCIILPITAYQVLDKPYGNVIDNVSPNNPFVDCVSFTTVVGSTSAGVAPTAEPSTASAAGEIEGTPTPSDATSEPTEEGSAEPSNEATMEPSMAPAPQPESAGGEITGPSSGAGTAEETSESSPEMSEESSMEPETSESPEESLESSMEPSPEVTM